jgi:putative hydrolase of the HAD superfamily
VAGKIKFIFFDVGNTLLFPNRQRIDAPLLDRGIVPGPDHLRDLEARIKNQFDEGMTQRGSTDQSFWWMFYTQLLAELEINDEALREQLVRNIRTSGNWNQIRPGTGERLQQIGKRFPLAVISNADGKIADVLQECSIAGYFRTITDSGIVGWEKPRKEIFQQALRSMNAAAEESLYVGDVYSVDYVGATRAGMQAVLMDVPQAYREKGVPRVESLAELGQWLGIEEAAL